jgi:uncharacterized protein (TIGR02246 family)
MVRRALWLAVGVIFLALPARAADEATTKEIQAAIDKYIAAYNEGSLNKVMAFWTENADFVDSRGQFHEGRDLIAALFRRGFASNPGRKLTLTSVARKLLAPDVVMDDGILELMAPDGDKDRGRYTVVLTKVNGQWLIRSARDIPLPDEESVAARERPPLEELEWLVGKWEAKSDKHQISLDCSWQLDRSFLVQRFLVKSSGEEDFEIVNWIAFDPAADSFHSWYFDSRGGFGGGPWTRRDNVWRTSVAAVLPDGQTGSSIMTWEQLDSNTARWKAIDREVEGSSVPDSEKTYVRVRTAATPLPAAIPQGARPPAAAPPVVRPPAAAPPVVRPPVAPKGR